MNTTNSNHKNPSLLFTNILLVLIALLSAGNLWMPKEKGIDVSGQTPTPSPTIAPPQEKQEVQKWEYKFVWVNDVIEGPFGGYEGIQTDGNTAIGLSGNTATLKAINQLGTEGWELVNTIHNYGETGANLIFKRQITQ